MNYLKIVCPTNQTMRIKKTIKDEILSPKKKNQQILREGQREIV